MRLEALVAETHRDRYPRSLSHHSDHLLKSSFLGNRGLLDLGLKSSDSRPCFVIFGLHLLHGMPGTRIYFDFGCRLGFSTSLRQYWNCNPSRDNISFCRCVDRLDLGLLPR